MRTWMVKHSPEDITTSDLDGESLHSEGHMWDPAPLPRTVLILTHWDGL